MASEQTQTYLKQLESKLAADGCNPQWQSWGSTSALVGRRSDFRLTWMATRLHLFTIAIAVDEVSPNGIREFTDHAIAYAKQNKGGLPVGLQNGVVVFPVMVGDRIDEAAAAWAEEKQRIGFSVMTRPVVVDATQGQARVFRGRTAIGAIYTNHIVRKCNLYFSQGS